MEPTTLGALEAAAAIRAGKLTAEELVRACPRPHRGARENPWRAMTVEARRLTPEAFAPFGQVLMAPGEGLARQEFAARLANRRPHARANLAFIRNPVASPPVTLTALERHPDSSQTFVPIDGTRYLVAVCPSGADGEPDFDRLVAFVADGSQAVNLDPGVWHAPNCPLAGPGEFVMLRWDDGSGQDTEWRPLAGPVLVSLPAL